MKFCIAAKTTPLLGSDVRLVISKFEEVVSIVMFLKELVESFGISVKTFNEAGLHTPIIRLSSTGIP